MAFGECPICGEKYHLRITDTSWYAERGLEIGETLKEKCYLCFRELEEYDVVEVISIPEGMTDVEVGDQATVLMVHDRKEKEPAYEVECVLPDGMTKWLGTIKRSNLKYVFEKQKE